MSYRDLLIWQYQGKPKALATAELLERTLAQGFIDLYQLQNVLNIEEATGDQLDLVGKHVGQSRVVSEFSLRYFFGFQGSKHAMGFGRINQNQPSGGEWYRHRDPLTKTILLDDENYRFLIKAKIIKNYQTGTLNNLIDACFFLFKQHYPITDNFDMTVTIRIPQDQLSSFQTWAIQYLDILPRQAGVKINLTLDQHIENPFFAFYGATEAKGFNQGIWYHINN